MSTPEEIRALQEQLARLQLENQQLRAQSVPTPTPVTREPKLKLPDPYDGNRGRYRAFVSQCRLIWTAHATRYPDDQAKIILLLSLLTGAAAQWATPLMEHPEALTNLDVFLKQFAAAFDDPDRAQSAAIAIEALKQGRRPCSIYASEFRRVATDLDWGESALVRAFYKGLSDEVKDRLSYALELPTSINDYIELATRLDQRQHERQWERSRQTNPRQPTSPPKYSPRRDRAAEAPVLTTAQPVVPMEIGRARRGPITPEERERRRLNNLCFYCGQLGHSANSCPAKLPPRQLHAVTVPEETPQENDNA
jgi:hypothetical protein